MTISLKTVCTGGCKHHPWQYSPLSCVKLLVDHGASVNPSLTALTASPLHEACIRGNPDCVKLMIDKGALLEAFDIYFGTPLHAACAKAHFDCALLLLNAGNPLSLQQLCRIVLRTVLGTRALELIPKLDISQRIIDYLIYKSQICEHVNV
ncbi:ankyrin repeat and SOCS box protein 13-like [Sinocyclocheilus grahami]|uniref:ankyrin repeat and SOCS box protein 13-like n=1 Tax=Sinocyclocheilus grahami TaxID=75366 RepID=UPI0007AD2000|nr:PREDICTED: ankyrin repeat and SOCS box protein 13-like [Sinocyclocheilus grahami]